MALPANPWQAIWKRLPAPLQNRYYLTLVIFFFILLFLDKHDVWTQFRLQRAINRLESDRSYYEQKIEEAREEAEDFELTKVLDVLEPLRSEITIYSGLSHPAARKVHGHSNADQYLTGAATGGHGP